MTDTFRLLSALVLISSLMTAMVNSASAQESTTDIFTETVCETSSYGQQTCREVTREKIKGIERVGKPVELVNAGLDLPSTLAIGAVLTSGLTALALKRLVS